MKKSPPFYDLAGMSENQRIKVICEAALQGHEVGFIVDDERKKIIRYIRKIKETLPHTTVKELGLVAAGCFAISVKLNKNN